jgi:crotonobetainyl-CoA:carnitine CoA-transferase CaiB-like acyl-CoA transferase
MHDGSLALQVLSFSALRTLGRTQPRGQDMLSGALPNYSFYECADGKFMAVGALEPKFWANLTMALGRPELGRKPLAPGKLSDPVRAEVAAIFKTKTRDEWEQLLLQHDACTTAILSLEEVLQNEQVKARGLVETVKGKPAPAMPIQFPGVTLPKCGDAPKLGEHNAEFLK